MTALFARRQGGGRLLVSIPHAGTVVPPEIEATLSEAGRLLVDTDWHVDRLYGFLDATDATVLVATHSRTVVDLNRGPGGGKLYPGQAETGICPAETFAGQPIYAAAAPDAEACAERVRRYWKPYHEALAGELARLRDLHGVVHLLDAHSIAGEVPRLFAGKLPDLNFGTNAGASAEASLVARVMRAAEGNGFSAVLDGRFKGGYITRHYGDPAHGVQAIQLELAQHTYMDEGAPGPFDAGRATGLVEVLKRIVEELLRA